MIKTDILRTPLTYLLGTLLLYCSLERKKYRLPLAGFLFLVWCCLSTLLIWNIAASDQIPAGEPLWTIKLIQHVVFFFPPHRAQTTWRHRPSALQVRPLWCPPPSPFAPSPPRPQPGLFAPRCAAYARKRPVSRKSGHAAEASGRSALGENIARVEWKLHFAGANISPGLWKIPFKWLQAEKRQRIRLAFCLTGFSTYTSWSVSRFDI